MLFAFNNFWLFVSMLLGGWVLYGLCGFEFTVITLLVTFLYTNVTKKS